MRDMSAFRASKAEDRVKLHGVLVYRVRVFRLLGFRVEGVLVRVRGFMARIFGANATER